MFDWFKNKSERPQKQQPTQQAAFRPAELPPRRPAPPKKSPAEVMRELRNGWLTKYQAGGHSGGNEVIAVVMDWPIGSDQIATVLSSSGGDASLYTTGTFGILGGIGHEKVREAAVAFVGCAQHFLSITQPTTSYPYPDSQTLQFYMVTPSGVRAVSFPIGAVEQANSPARALFGCGQQVVTELRLTMPNQK